MCKAIENSSPEQKKLYLEQMAKTCSHKAELIMPWVKKGNIVDLGCADGEFTIQLSRKFQPCFVTGVDMSPAIVEIARNRAKEANLFGLHFKEGTSENYTEPSDNVICSSILHEVYSYANGKPAIGQTLHNIHKNLIKGGRLIIRDFVKPVYSNYVDLWHSASDFRKGHTLYDFLKQRGYYKPECGYEDNGGLYYRDIPFNEIYEYIYHKDYHDNWETEVKETYGFATLEELKSMLQAHGFTIIHSAEMDNQWIVDNRLEGKVRIHDEGADKDVSFPKYQMLIVAEKA